MQRLNVSPSPPKVKKTIIVHIYNRKSVKEASLILISDPSSADVCPEYELTNKEKPRKAGAKTLAKEKGKSSVWRDLTVLFMTVRVRSDANAPSPEAGGALPAGFSTQRNEDK